MRSRWSLVAVVLATIAAHAACVEGIEFIATGSSTSTGPGGSGPGGTGAAGSTSSVGGSGAATSSTTGTGGTGGCMPAQCPGIETLCIHKICTLGMCDVQYEPDNSQVGTMAAGDCKKLECNTSHVALPVEDTSDPYFDGNECTTDSCNGTTPVNDTLTERAPCPGGMGFCCSSLYCDLAPQGMACRECHPDVMGSCTNMSTPVCQRGKCVPAHCTNTMKDGDEGGPDCGGSCALCPDGADCTAPANCASNVCSGTPKKCAAPTCIDNNKNGNETGPDCGGSCPNKCVDGFGCAFPMDCESGVCLLNQCQMPTCMDGVKNGSETDPDCGGTCSPCP
jgi:hypothetical protein